MTDDDYPQPTPDKQRTKTAAAAGQLTATVLDQAVDVDDELRRLVGLDDEQLWAERDARVRRVRELEEGQQRRDEHRRRALLLKSEPHFFPSIAVDAALADWPKQTPAMAAVREYLRSPYLLLILAGGVGAGKTCAATYAALEVGGSAPAFLRASELEGRGRYDKDLRDWLRTRSMLVLDDLGSEYLDGKNAFRSLLDEVVDIYYGDRKRLIVTTNLLKRRPERPGGVIQIGDPPQFIERYGERVTSRFVQSGLWCDCGAEDLRRGARP